MSDATSDRFSDMCSETGTSASARGKRGRVTSGLGDAADSELASKAKRRVMQAMKNDNQLAQRIDYLITAGKLSKTGGTKGGDTLYQLAATSST